MKFACFWLLGAIVGYALEGTIAAALIVGIIAFYLGLALAASLDEQEGE